MFSRGVRLARHRRDDLRRPQEARAHLDRPDLASGPVDAARRPRASAPTSGRLPARPNRHDRTMEFFRFRRDIPFMRHALAFNVISLVTFLLAVFFLATRGLNFGVDFRGGTVIEVNYAHAVDFDRVRAAIDKLEVGEYSAQSFGDAEHRADPAAAQAGRVERAALGARDDRAQGGRPDRDAGARRVRRAAGRQGALRERRARAAARGARHRRLPRDAVRVALRASRRSSRTCTT